jgi:hypothetical protein
MYRVNREGTAEKGFLILISEILYGSKSYVTQRSLLVPGSSLKRNVHLVPALCGFHLRGF